MRAVSAVFNEPELLSLGVINALYEASLHVFVFVWTPALERRGGDRAVPHGVVFSLFMACKMAGSQAYTAFGERVPAGTTLRAVFLGSLIAFATPIAFHGYWITLLCFCGFEFGLGMYWPAIAVLRAELVPNRLRATMTSVFRVPLNALVIACLAFAGSSSEPGFLAMCAGMMTSCLFVARHRALNKEAA
jgi:MFS family permease